MADKPRGPRFSEIKVGDQLMVAYTTKYTTVDGNGGTVEGEFPREVWFWIVTDLFFDPVKGEDNPTSGSMVAIKRLDPHTGEPVGPKRSYNLRGLASNGYHYADRDFTETRRLIRAAAQDGKVVGIGRGHVLRQRPKSPGHRL
jgi:hypothetical protein